MTPTSTSSAGAARVAGLVHALDGDCFMTTSPMIDLTAVLMVGQYVPSGKIYSMKDCGLVGEAVCVKNLRTFGLFAPKLSRLCIKFPKDLLVAGFI